MPRIHLWAAWVICAGVAWADISYVTTVKSGGYATGATTRFKMKGAKMRMESADSVTLVDMDAKTLTVLRPSTKTYTVRKMEEGAVALKQAGTQLKTSVRETGLTKKIGNYACRQVMMTMEMAGSQASLTMENEMWVSRDVAGLAEWKAATQRMADKAMGPVAADAGTRKMLADMQREMAKVDGVPVLQITRMKMGREMQEKMKAARKQMEDMKKMGGKQGEMAEKALAGMQGGNLMEMVTEWGGFSTAAVAASEFTVPAGYRKADK